MSASGFVGRARERAELRAGLDDAARGRGRLYLIAGDPGIGKTRLVDELADEAHTAGMTVAWGRCWEGGGAPAYWPWVQVLRALARVSGSEVLAARAGPGAAHLAQLVPGIGSPAAEPTPLDADRARFELFDAVAGCLRATADEQPLAILLDDLHAADRASLLLLSFLAREMRDARVVIAGTYRDVDALLDPDVADLLGDLAREARLFHLGGLGRDDVARLITHAAGTEPGPSVVAAVHAATDGNPFFIDELARLLAAEGRLASTGTRLPIPVGVRAAITRRVERLPASTAELIQVASVVGRSFDLDVLGTVTGHAREQLLDLLEPAVTARLLGDEERSIGRYTFAHALTRDTMYDEIPAGRRARLHRAVAESVEKLRATSIDDHLSELAHHFIEAARSGDPDPAIDYSLRAGRRAIAMLAYEPAVTHFERALDAADLEPPASPEQRAAITLALADALWRAGRLAEARAAFQRAGEIARASGDATSLARAALGYSEVDTGGTWTRGWTSDPIAVALLRDALDGMPAEDSIDRALVLARFGAGLHFSDQRDRGVEHARAALAIAERLGDARTLAYCLTALHLAIWNADTAEERLALATRAVELARAGGDRELEMQARVWRHTDLIETGQMAAGLAEADTYIAMAAETGRPQYAAFAAMLRAARAHLEGRIDDAEAAAIEARAYGESSGDATVIGSSAVLMMRIRYEQDRLTESAHELFDLLPVSHASAWTRIWCLAVLARDGSASPTEARTMLHEYADRAETLPQDAFWLSGMSFLAEAMWLLSDDVLAASLLERIGPYTERIAVDGRNGVTYPAPMARYVGMLASLTGDLPRAEAAFEAARATAAEHGSPVWRATAACDLAEMLADRGADGDAARAVTLAKEATMIAEQHRLPLSLRRAKNILEQLGRSSVAAGAYAFMREGDVWAISMGSEVVRVRDSKGMGYIATLLANPHREIRALDLMTGPAERPPVEAIDLDLAGSEDAGPVLDAEAKAAYKRRLAALREEAEEARALEDDDREARAEAEIEQLTRALAAAVGLGGRDRPLGSAAERARINVTKSVKAAIERIRSATPEMAEHLAATIRTGAACSYAPDPRSAPSWRL